jgi:hypothetical protein
MEKMENKIIKEVKKLKKDISPRLEWVVLSRDLLLQQINPQKKRQAVRVGAGDYAQLFGQIFRQRMLEPAVIMLLVLGVFLGSSLAINAAFYSLPGDQLYRVKIALEKTHVALIPSEEKKVELKMEFAQKRIEEFNKIVAQADVSPEVKKKKIQVVVQEFKNNVAAANNHLNNMTDKDQTVKMAVAVSSKTEELAKSFDEKVEELSAVEKLEVEEIVAEAVQSAQDAGLSAQQLAEEINQTEEEGIVEGAENEVVEEGAEETTEVEEEVVEEGAEETTEVEEEVVEEGLSEVIPETTTDIIE